MSALENGRLIDIPYGKSPPVIFSFRQTAPLALGVYDFGGVGSPLVRSLFTPNRPILPNVLYIFSGLSFSMDVDQNDYQGAIASLPAFSTFLQSDASAPAFREPILLDKYFENYSYILSLMGSSSVNRPANTGGDTFNKLFGSVTGTVNQTAALVGKASLTAIVKMTAQEISDGEFISQYTKMGNAAAQAKRAPQGKQL